MKQIIPEKSSEKVAKFLKKSSLHKRDFAEMIGVTLSYVYNLIDETFKNKGEKVFSLYFSNKFLDSPTGEIIKDKYANRSIYILSSPCLKKNICDKECLNAVELLNASKLGKNLIHQLLDIRTDTDIRNDVPKSAFIEKCLVYDFNLRPV